VGLLLDGLRCVGVAGLVENCLDDSAGDLAQLSPLPFAGQWPENDLERGDLSIGQRSAAEEPEVICHLREKLAEKAELLVEEDWVAWAREFSVKTLRDLARTARHVVDPDGFLKDENENFEQRHLYISQMGPMFVIDACSTQSAERRSRRRSTP